MPIDLASVIGAELPPMSHSWAPEDVILYNLGIGAGVPPTSSRELRYAYEAELAALPTYGTIPPFAMMMSLDMIEGLDISLADVLHGHHDLTVHGPIPTRGAVRQRGSVVDVFDKGRGALVIFEVVSTDEATDEPLFTNRAGIYVRGEGGFGGRSGPSTSHQPPDRDPDEVIEVATLLQQALLYRMASGDKNPLHADPGFASLAGFERPILHGLCTYGIVCKAVVDAALGGEPGRVGGMAARFTGHVFPGETLSIRVWSEGARHLVMAETKERGTKVIADGVVRERSGVG